MRQWRKLVSDLWTVSGCASEYQCTKGIRGEDLRRDRQRGVTQIDCETSCLDEVEIRAIFEEMIRTVFRNALGVKRPNQFPTMTYGEAMRLYGSDKPDLRVKLQFTDLTEVMKTVDFKVFSGAANQEGGRVVGLRVPGGAELTRGEIDAYTQFVAIYGARGLAYIKVNDAARGREGLQSPIVKNLHDNALDAVLSRPGARNGNSIFYGSDQAQVVNVAHRLCPNRMHSY